MVAFFLDCFSFSDSLGGGGAYVFGFLGGVSRVLSDFVKKRGSNPKTKNPFSFDTLAIVKGEPGWKQ